MDELGEEGLQKRLTGRQPAPFPTVPQRSPRRAPTPRCHQHKGNMVLSMTTFRSREDTGWQGERGSQGEGEMKGDHGPALPVPLTILPGASLTWEGEHGTAFFPRGEGQRLK